MTAVTTVAQTDIFQWIDKAIENLNFKYHKSTITGTTENGDGYVGDVVFVKVSATTEDDEKKELNVVVKHGKPDEQLRKALPTRMAFETEIFFYNTILPSFTRLQEEYNIKNAFDAVPKCYKTLILSNMEVIIMENLKIIGYELHDKLAPLNVGHLKAGLTEYGKLHALSYALKEKKRPNEFKAITSDISEPIKAFLQDKRGIGIMFKNGIADCMKILQENGDTELVEKLKPKLNKDIDDILLDLACEECSHRVITHGDCWNNNFMFKYEDKNKLTPSKIAILDWQVIGLRSPVIDLSYFIYANAAGSKLDLLQLKELLETYYNSFTNFLGNFVHNPEELFSFSELRNHWRRFSLYGFIMGCCVMRYALLSKEDTFAFEGLSEGDDIEKVVGNKISDKDLFYSRVKDLVRLYVSNEF